MRARASAGAALAAALAAAAPAAAEWSVRAFFSQRLEADDGGDGDGRVNTVSDLGLSFATSTPTTSLTLAPGVNFTFSSTDSADVNDFNPRFNGSLSHSNGRWRLDSGLSVVPRLTNSSRLVDDPDAPDGGAPGLTLDTVDEDVIELSIGANAGLGYSLDPITTLSANADARLRRFTGGGDFDDTESYGFSLSLSRDLDPRSSGSVGLSYRLFSGAGDGSSSQSLGVDIGFDRRLTPALNFASGVGVSAVVSDSETDLGLTGDASLNYRGPDYDFRFGATQSIDQDEFGALQALTSLSGAASYRINDRARLSLSSSLTRETPFFSEGGDDAVNAAIGPSLSYSLDADWRATLGYRLGAQTGGDDDDELSNLVFVEISRGIALLP